MASCGGLAFLALGFEREVDHHDGVLLHDADQQDDADQRDDAEIGVADHQGQQRADARRGQRRKNRDGMDVAFIQHAQHDVDRDQRRQNQNRLVGQRGLKRRRRALERRLQCWPACPAPPCALSIAVTASPSEAPGARLKDSVTTGNCPWWFTASGAVTRSNMRERARAAPRRPSASGRKCSSARPDSC